MKNTAGVQLELKDLDKVKQTNTDGVSKVTKALHFALSQDINIQKLT